MEVGIFCFALIQRCTFFDHTPLTEAMEALQPKFCFNPSTQRVLQGIHDRALKGTLDTSSEELPKMEPKLSKAINPHLDLWPESTAEARSIGERFPLEEVRLLLSPFGACNFTH